MGVGGCVLQVACRVLGVAWELVKLRVMGFRVSSADYCLSCVRAKRGVGTLIRRNESNDGVLISEVKYYLIGPG